MDEIDKWGYYYIGRMQYGNLKLIDELVGKYKAFYEKHAFAIENYSEFFSVLFSFYNSSLYNYEQEYRLIHYNEFNINTDGHEYRSVIETTIENETLKHYHILNLKDKIRCSPNVKIKRIILGYSIENHGINEYLNLLAKRFLGYNVIVENCKFT